MKRLALIIAILILGGLFASTARAGDWPPTPDPYPSSGLVQRCMYVAPHWGRQAPAAAQNLHVFDYTNSLPIYRAFTNSEGWYFYRYYGTYLAKVLWHESPNWISNFSDVPVAACFFVTR